MLPILETPSFLGGLGKGLSVGIPQGVQSITDMLQTRKKEKMIQNILNPQSQQQPSSQGSPVDKDELFRNLAMNIEQETGQDLQPDDLDKLWQQIQSSPIGQQAGMPQQNQPGQWTDQQILAMQKVDPNTANLMAKMQATQQKERLQGRKEEFAREKEAEPKVEAMRDTLRSTENTGMQLDALNELFSASNDEDFPSPLITGLFTKDGQLNPVFESQLSPKAARATKIIADQIRGIRDVLGSQITGFEVQQWLNRLPKLLMSPEGRREVTRDLRVFNKLNEHYQRGVLDIIDREGGPGKVSMSKAKGLYEKENRDEISELRDLYINPDRKSFNRLPPAWAYPGKKFRDPETGKILMSNGQDYIEAEK